MTAPWDPALRQQGQLTAATFAWGPAVDPAVALAVACRHFGVSPAELVSHRRRDALVQARAFAVWMLRTFGAPLAYPAIGECLGRHHSAAINLHMLAIRLRLQDRAFAAACRGVIDHYLFAQEVSHACH